MFALSLHLHDVETEQFATVAVSDNVLANHDILPLSTVEIGK